VCLIFLDMSIPVDGSISISFSNEESASPTYRGEIGRVSMSAQLMTEHCAELTKSSWRRGLG
jgi:hypothetical protein